MATSTLLLPIKSYAPLPSQNFSKSHFGSKKILIANSNPRGRRRRRRGRVCQPCCSSPSSMSLDRPNAIWGLSEAMNMMRSAPPTWQSALLSNLLIFVVGSPLLVAGLSLSGIGAAFLLGTLTWRAFGPSGFLLVASYFVIGTAATKVKMAQKEAQGVAEKRKGRRGPGSVIGSSAAGCVCAFLAIYRVGGEAFARLWQLGFVASFCTKLNDTVSSEMGKAYGKTTYLVTTLKVVPRGTEGAVSVEGTLAGLLASFLLASIGCLMGEIANIGESIIGAALQEKEGFRWLEQYVTSAHYPTLTLLRKRRILDYIDIDITRPNRLSFGEKLNNDAVNVINISMGSILAVLMQQVILQK